MREVVAELQRKVEQLFALYLGLSAKTPSASRAQLVPRDAPASSVELLPSDIQYACTKSVQVGDPIGISADDTVTQADNTVPILAIGFCVAKLSPTLCMVRRAGLVPRSGSQAGRIYYLGAGPGAVTADDPGADPEAKIFQRLAVGENGGMLDACVTLQFTTLHV